MSDVRAPWVRLVGVNALVGAVYAALGAATLVLGQLSGLAAPVWPAAGVALAFVLVHGWRVVPGIVVGSFVANAVTLTQADLATQTIVTQASAVALGAVLQALCGRWLVTRYISGWSALLTARQILMFLLLAGPIACVVNPTIGVLSQVATGIIGADQAVTTWLTWWVGDSIGVIVFAPLTLMLMRDPAGHWTGRRWKIALPSLLIVAAFLLAVLQSTSLEEDRARLQLAQVSVEATADLRRNLDRQSEVLQGVKGLIVAGGEPTAEEFADYTRGTLARFPDLAALSWNPVVTAEELDGFIRSQRQQAGFEDFTVSERDGDGELQDVAPRREYVVVRYIEPRAANRSALGFDIASTPARAQALAQARDTGRPIATAPIDLVQDGSSQKGMLALLPVYQGKVDPAGAAERTEAVIGYAVGVYRLEDLLANTFTGAVWDSYRLRLIDVTGTGEPVVLADRSAREAASVDRAGDGVRAVSVPFDAYGRAWELEVTPTGGISPGNASGITPSFLLAGLMLIFLLEAFVLLLTGLEQQARREAESSSFDANHDPLTGLLNRRAFERRLQSIQTSEADDAARHVLLFMDLDGFKAVNDTGGHDVGDALLVGLAQCMRAQVRTRDAVARVGGDEFAALLIDCPLTRGMDISESLVSAVEAFSVPLGGERLRVGVSIGAVVVDPAEGLSSDELMRRADSACYDAKRGGKGHVRLYGATGVGP